MSESGAAREPIETEAAGPRPLGATAIGLTLLTAALWGGTPVAVSFSVDVLPPLAVAAVRFVLAAAFMLGWCFFTRTPVWLRFEQLVPCLVTGSLLFLQISTFNLGIYFSNSSHATLLINTFVFWVIAIEHFITRTDRATPRRLLGLLVAAASVSLILPSGSAGSTGAGEVAAADMPSLAGDALLLTSALLLGIKIVYTKQALRVVEPGKLILWHDVVGVVWFLAGSLWLENASLHALDLPAVLGLLYQGLVVAGLCFAIQAMLLERHSASQISVFSFSTPLFGVVVAMLLRGDPLSPWLVASAVGVAFGIWLVTGRGASAK